MAWFESHLSSGGGGGGGNYTDAIWDGTLINNVYIDTNNGNEIPYNGWSATDFLEIDGSSAIYKCGGICKSDYNAWYDSDKHYISGFGASDIDTVPQNAAYVRYSKNTIYMVGKIFREA